MAGERTLFDAHEYLVPLLNMLNRRIADYALLLTLGEVAEPCSTSFGPSAAERKRELLPLPFGPPEESLLPKNDLYTADAKRQKAARSGWLLLMAAVLNDHFMLGTNAGNDIGCHGPPTAAQEAALFRLATAADARCALSPLSFGECDWTHELPRTRLSYGGTQVLKAEDLSLARMLPTLPPRGMASRWT